MPLVYGGPEATIALQNCTFTQNFGRDDLGQGSGNDTVRFPSLILANTCLFASPGTSFYYSLCCPTEPQMALHLAR